MRKNLSPFLRKHLEMLCRGYSNARIAKETRHSEAVVNQYTQRLKKWFQDEPELQEGSQYSTKTALLLIGKRYFEELESANKAPQEEQPISPQIVRLDYDFLLDRYKYHHSLIYQIGARGDAAFAVESATQTIEEIKRALSNINEDKYRHPLLEIVALLLYVRATNYTKIAPPIETFNYSKSAAHTIKEIAKECGNAELFGLAEHTLGDGYYIIRKSLMAIPILLKALDLVKNPDERLRTLRTLALTSVYTDNIKEYEQTETITRDLIESGHWTKPERVVLALEGLGRCQGMRGSIEAFDTFQQAYQIISTIKANNVRLPFREVQLMRSELEVIRLLLPEDKDLLQKYGMEALRTASEYGYPRHVKQINKLLNKQLN